MWIVRVWSRSSPPKDVYQSRWLLLARAYRFFNYDINPCADVTEVWSIEHEVTA